MGKFTYTLVLLLFVSSASASWVLLPADSPTSRIKTYVDDAEYGGGVISVKTQFAYGEAIFQKANLFSDMSFSCLKYTFIGRMGDSAIIKRTELSGQVRTSNFMYSVLKDLPSFRGKDNKKYSGVTLICSESTSEPTSLSSENYYIALRQSKANFTFGDFWNQAEMTIDISDSTGKFEFFPLK